ncbi:MAG: methyltransferase domain-containing protein [Alphaproteobacteria bacterium]|nr:methyltransferase domain-containing protein [Alphaproteobacteria bacterium]
MPGNEQTVFDRSLLRHRRNRAAQRMGDHDFLFREVADRLLERLEDVARVFDTALDLGARDGAFADQLRLSGRAHQVMLCDRSPVFAAQATAHGHPIFVADEDMLPLRDESFDLITSSLALHWVNDLPGALVQINRALKPDGLFQGAILGGETLTELRQCLMEAELAEMGGVSPRVSPMVDLRDAAGLLQRAGFALPVADMDRIEVSYADPFRLMADLRAMGEANAVLERLKHGTRRSVFLRAAELYASRFAGPDGRITARFEVIFLHGWRPAATQPKPLAPGSAKSRLADALGVQEIPTGDPVGPNGSDRSD